MCSQDINITDNDFLGEERITNIIIQSSPKELSDKINDFLDKNRDRQNEITTWSERITCKHSLVP